MDGAESLIPLEGNGNTELLQKKPPDLTIRPSVVWMTKISNQRASHVMKCKSYDLSFSNEQIGRECRE